MPRSGIKLDGNFGGISSLSGGTSGKNTLKKDSPRESAHTEIVGILMYTQEDTELEQYVRKYLQPLSNMSDPHFLIYITEKVAKYTGKKTDKPRFWEKFLSVRSIENTLSYPFDKSRTYDFARKMGIYADQIPCLVLLKSRDIHAEKLVFPICQASPTFFRTLFTAFNQVIDESLSLKQGVDSAEKFKNQVDSKMLFEIIENKIEFIRDKISTFETGRINLKTTTEATLEISSDISRETILELLETHKRYIEHLCIQKAKMGIQCPPHIILEIEDREKTVQLLLKSLQRE